MCDGFHGVSLNQVNVTCIKFNVSATLNNAYHSNSNLIGKSPEEAKQVLSLANGRNTKLSAEAGVLERAKGSKCLSAWTQPETYSKLTEWCNSKRAEVPSDITSWLRFLGNGADGLLGFTEFLKGLPPDGAPLPSGATATSNCTGGCAAEKQLLQQTAETLKAKVIELETAGKILEQQLKKLSDNFLKKSVELNNLTKRHARAKAAKERHAARIGNLTKSLKRKQKVIDEESPKQRQRRDLCDLTKGSGQYHERVKQVRASLAPKTCGVIKARNKENKASGR